MEQQLKTSPKIDPNPIELATTADSDAGYLSFPFTVDAEGCTVRFGLEQTYYHLAATLPHYNALYSLLLACWVNGYKIWFTYKVPVRGSHPPLDPHARTTLSVVSAHASPLKS